MIRESLTYGQLPTFIDFLRAWKDETGSNVARMQFRNDEVFGENRFVDAATVWKALVEQVNLGTDQALDWCSCVLEVLGFEWI